MIIQLITGDVNLNQFHIKALKEVYSYSITVDRPKPILLELILYGLVHRNGNFYECTSKGDAVMKIINRLKRDYIGEPIGETVYKPIL